MLPVLAGCSSDADDQQALDRVFLEQAHRMAPDVPDANLLDVRKEFCKALDADPRRGKYLVLLATVMAEPAFKNHAGGMAATFVATGCPQHQDLVP